MSIVCLLLFFKLLRSVVFRNQFCEKRSPVAQPIPNLCDVSVTNANVLRCYESEKAALIIPGYGGDAKCITHMPYSRVRNEKSFFVT